MILSITVNELKRLEFFQGISIGIIQSILNEGSVVEYKKRDMLFHAKTVMDAVYIVLTGQVMLYNLTKHGNRKIIFILGSGRLLNQSIVSAKPIPLFCEAAGDVRVLKIPMPIFEEWMKKQPELMYAVMKEYERYLWRLGHQLKNTAGNIHLERKIAAKLWKLGRDFGIQEGEGLKINIELTITLMADLVGAPRENVSRACKVLSDKKLIRYKNKRFILLDPDGLAQFYKM